MDTAPHAQFSTRRFAQLMGAIVIGVAGIGYVVGLRQAVPIERAGPVMNAPVNSDTAVPSTHYAAIGDATAWPNRTFATRLRAVPAPTVSQDTVVVVDPAARAAAVAARAARRAYAGAPPTIPHAVDARSAAACMACHGTGFVVGSVRAPRIPHTAYANCLQCHVEAATSALGTSPPPSNAFVGLASPGSGARAWAGAPPTVPHSTWMRADCLACHGAGGALGLRSTHAWRQNCLQCHATSWQIELRPNADQTAESWGTTLKDPR